MKPCRDIQSTFVPIDIFLKDALQIPDSHFEKGNTQNGQIIAHFEYFFTCYYSKACLARRESQQDKNYSLWENLFSNQAKIFSFWERVGNQ